ncbi:MAG: serine/threonine protein phosphatase [Bacteroidales bacterium]|nr:serine/threonine protein phosphatase [Bacteroidales bacterium]
MGKVKHQYIEKMNGTRRFVIGDIHGCYKTLRALIDKAGIKKEDQLFFLGDYIDRGPNSKEVVDYIMDMMNTGYKIFPLLGNHEADLLEYMKEEPHVLEWHMKKGKYESMMEGKTVSPKYVEFIKSLPHYIDTGDFYLVHAGFNFSKTKPFEDIGDMLCLRRIEPDTIQLNGRRIIHGHQPFYFEDITSRIINRDLVIPLDNGVPYVKKHKIYDYTRLGQLCCFNMDTFEFIAQKNVDIL